MSHFLTTRWWYKEFFKNQREKIKNLSFDESWTSNSRIPSSEGYPLHHVYVLQIGDGRENKVIGKLEKNGYSG